MISTFDVKLEEREMLRDNYFVTISGDVNTIY